MEARVRFAAVAAAFSIFALSATAGAQEHKPGGLNKVARDISKTSKKAGSDAKGELKTVKGGAHATTTEAGKSVKDTVLKGKP